MADEKKSEQTERILLKRRIVEVDQSELDDGMAAAMQEAWVPICDPSSGEPRIFRATSKKAAMEAYAGKKGKDHPGTYRAPSLRSWREEHEFEPDPEPQMRETVRP